MRAQSLDRLPDWTTLKARVIRSSIRPCMHACMRISEERMASEIQIITMMHGYMVYASLCVRTCMYVYIHAYRQLSSIYTYIHTWIYIYTYIYMYISISIYTSYMHMQYLLNYTLQETNIHMLSSFLTISLDSLRAKTPGSGEVFWLTFTSKRQIYILYMRMHKYHHHIKRLTCIYIYIYIYII